MQRELDLRDLPRRAVDGAKGGRVEAPTAATTGLLACGVASSALYVAMDAMLSLRYGGYSYADQAVSELNATGAPTRSAFLACSVAYNVLLTAFGAGVWRSGRQRAVRITGGFLIASAAVGMATPLFFPMDQRGADETLRGGLHGPMTGIGALFILLAMGFGATLHGRRFRGYTYATMAALIVFGLATALYVPRLTAQESTPAMGLVERVNIYAYLAWVAALAISLMQLRGTDLPRLESESSP